MDLSDDINKTNVFKEDDTTLNSLVAPSDHDQSDSEDDFALSSMIDQDSLDYYNISSNLKNILRMDNHDIDLGEDFQDDSESDDDSILHGRRFEKSVDIDKLNEEIEKNKNKFTNFPLLPPSEEQEGQTKEQQKRKPRKPREKKKRREKKDVFEAQREARANNLNKLLKNLKKGGEESEEDEEMTTKTRSKHSGRKTRKKESNELKVDENGERLVRSTALLDDSSEEEERRLSKREELEMYREAERHRRAANITLKPVYNVKSFDEFVKRRDKNEQDYLRSLELEKQQRARSSSAIPNKHEESDDSDLEIIGDPKKIAASLLSPDRVRYPVASFSPIRHASMALREHNRRMLDRITNEGYEHRIKMEEEAKARGHFASATERAKRLLEKEKDALLIKQQVDMHFEMKKDAGKKYSDYSEEDDEDYEDTADILDDLSGSEEEDERNVQSKRKMDESEEEEEEEEDNMATMAFKRWKGKKVKKSIFDDDDDDDDDKDSSAKKKTSQKPEPAHSIVNFFKAKEVKATSTEENADQEQNKRLNRLVRRNSNDTINDVNEEEPVDNSDIMDIDELSIPVTKSYKHVTLSKSKENNDYLEEEAEEDEDEFFGVAGSDEEIGENLDEFEDDGLLVEDNNEHVDESVLRDAFIQQDKESDNNLIQRLITDIAGGGLRRQKAAAEAGLMIDDIDLYDEDNDLIAIRRAAEARRRKLLKQKGGDVLENLLNDPKTAAFAKAAQALPDESLIAFLSESEPDEEEEENESQDENGDFMSLRDKNRIIIEEDVEDEDEDEEENDIEVIQDVSRQIKDDDALMDDISDDENFVIVDGFNTNSSSLQEGIVNNAA